jgi:hypothetical protein
MNLDLKFCLLSNELLFADCATKNGVVWIFFLGFSKIIEGFMSLIHLTRFMTWYWFVFWSIRDLRFSIILDILYNFFHIWHDCKGLLLNLQFYLSFFYLWSKTYLKFGDDTFQVSDKKIFCRLIFHKGFLEIIRYCSLLNKFSLDLFIVQKWK